MGSKVASRGSARMVRLRVRDVFATMQGEGSRAGTPCVFLRLAGCNLWAGTEAARAGGAGQCAAWCDTDFFGGESLEPEEIVASIMALMPRWPSPAVVISGGEPLLQLRQPAGKRLVERLKSAGVHVAVETNGTVQADILVELDHVTVSPKRLVVEREDRLQHIVVRQGTDLKVVSPQWDNEDMVAMGSWGFRHRYVQPLDDGNSHSKSARRALEAASRLGWQVSLQTHKLVGLE